MQFVSAVLVCDPFANSDICTRHECHLPSRCTNTALSASLLHGVYFADVGHCPVGTRAVLLHCA